MYLGPFSSDMGPLFKQEVKPIEPMLHEARLVGSYHAAQVLFSDAIEFYWRWFSLLSKDDMKYLLAYEERGEWGRLDLSEPLPVSPQTLADAVSDVTKAMNDMKYSLAKAFAPSLVASFSGLLTFGLTKDIE